MKFCYIGAHVAQTVEWCGSRRSMDCIAQSMSLRLHRQSMDLRIACSIHWLRKTKGTGHRFEQSSGIDVCHYGRSWRMPRSCRDGASNHLLLQNQAALSQIKQVGKIYCLKDGSSFKLVQTVVPSWIEQAVQHNFNVTAKVTSSVRAQSLTSALCDRIHGLHITHTLCIMQSYYPNYMPWLIDSSVKPQRSNSWEPLTNV